MPTLLQIERAMDDKTTSELIRNIKGDTQYLRDRLDKLPCIEHAERLACTEATGRMSKWVIGVFLTIIGLLLTAVFTQACTPVLPPLEFCDPTEKRQAEAWKIVLQEVEKEFPGKAKELDKLIKNYEMYFVKKTRLYQNNYNTFVYFLGDRYNGLHFKRAMDIYIAWRGNFSAMGIYAHEIMHALSIIVNGHTDHNHEDKRLFGKNGLEMKISKALSMKGL